MKKIIDDAPETLETAIETMRRKILELADDFADAPLDVETEMGSGRTVIKANPFVQEYRALVREYATAVKAYRELTDGNEVAEISSLDVIRSRLKVAK